MPNEENNQDQMSGIFIPLRAPNDTGEFDLSYWIAYLLTRKILIVSVTLLAAIAAITLAFISTPIYRAEVLLAPVSEQSDSSLFSGLASQFDTLSSVAGLNLGEDSATEEAIATLRSRDFTVRFIRTENLMPILFAGKWDASSDTWISDDPEEIPTEWDAYEYFNSSIRGVTEEVNGLLTVSVDWKDRELAAKWANGLVAELNALMRRRAIDEATANIAYLQQELQSTSIVELKTAISRLIEAQVKTAMLARVRDQFSFRVIDPAVSPDADRFISPNRVLIIAFGLFFGFCVGVFASIVTRRELRESK
ncbi:MAG: Wzz/FepE/Etk N-terminal domain-containing protein [Woeseiaceae bacterium]